MARSTQYIGWVLACLDEGQEMAGSQTQEYWDTMREFFRGIPDPTDLDRLARRKINPHYPYQQTIDKFTDLSGPNDRKEDTNGNPYWIESTSVLGD